MKTKVVFKVTVLGSTETEKFEETMHKVQAELAKYGKVEISSESLVAA